LNEYIGVNKYLFIFAFLLARGGKSIYQKVTAFDSEKVIKILN